MGIIRILPENIRNMIAAGEVVAGPFSVVKELVENAIDAGADRITVTLDDGGLSRITVTDNGSGMLRDDVPLALERNATSKIATVDDILAIGSYGFRGEALASIASVSRLSLFTRHHSETMGTRLSGTPDNPDISDYAGPVGTSIIVENLFHNTPARKKFMKSAAGEKRLVRDTFYALALAAPGITFSLSFDTSPPTVLPAVADIRARIHQIYGSAELLEGSLDDIDVTIHGYISSPDHLRKSRNQHFFVNGRPVELKNLNFHLLRAYDGFNAAGYPEAFIFLDITRSLVDVNVHPAKKEVRFFDQSYIDSLIYGLAKKILGSNVYSLGGVPESSSIAESDSPAHGGIYGDPAAWHTAAAGDTTRVMNNSAVQSTDSFKTEDADTEELFTSDASPRSYRVIGTVFNTYILAEAGNELLCVDFHAAHERMLYDRILARDHETDTVRLMIPVTFELPVHARDLILDSAELLHRAGFEIEQISETAFTVTQLPAFLKDIDIASLVMEYTESGAGRDRRERLAALSACHSARRAGDSISSDEMDLLLQAVFAGTMELRCPHGRPFVFRLTRAELERMFRR